MVPMLDVQLSVDHSDEGKQVCYRFYEKDYASDCVLMYNSAMSTTTKVTTLSNEVIRRMKHMDRLWDRTHHAEVITNLMVKLTRSKYPATVREQVLKSGLQGYYNMVWKEFTKMILALATWWRCMLWK